MFTKQLRRFQPVICIALVAVCAPIAYAQVRVVKTPPTKGSNQFYVGNRPPLLPNPLIKLPIGSIRPEGWLRTQLELMTDGFTGRLPELSEFCKFDGNAWVSPTGEGHHGWEEVPYWLKGLGDLGYVLRDQRVTDEARKWLDGVISSQRADGYFGPEANRKALDLWPNMPALDALRSYYEFTGDKRVLKLMSGYFRWMNTLPLEQILPGSWQKIRAGDNLYNIYWLYNQTGEEWLLDVARVNHERTADWTGGIASWHGVNIGQAFREPAEYYQQTRDLRYLNAAKRNYDTVIGKYGQVPGGLFGSDENCREGYVGPRQGTETCTMAEMMWSHEMLLGITGDPLWADRCEEVAFNSLPCSMTADLKALHYLTAPNQIQLDRANKAPMIQNGGDMFSYNPYGFRCCQHNVAFGWPYFAEHLWMATRDNGLAASLYAACSVKAKAAGGAEVSITESTAYPFENSISFAVTVSKPARFPLYLRIPVWCNNPGVEINGKAQSMPSVASGWLLVDQTWRSGDRVRLTLPMSIRLKTWEKNKDAVSVYRGPLIYSLKIGERWERYGGTDDWQLLEAFPTTPWNYGLVVDPKDPASTFAVVSEPKSLAAQPFTVQAAPVEIRAKARRIPGWKQETNGMVGDIQRSPARSAEPTEEVTLIPMGCARLRITAFPRISDGSDALEWEEASVKATASYVFNTIEALNDGETPSNSSDQSIPRFTWWDHRGSQEWVQYDFGKPRRVDSCAVYWFDDTASSGGCAVPASWRLSYWDGAARQPVADASGYATSRDAFNRVEFKPVETTKLRMDVQLQPNLSAGILEWRVGPKTR